MKGYIILLAILLIIGIALLLTNNSLAGYIVLGLFGLLLLIAILKRLNKGKYHFTKIPNQFQRINRFIA